MIPVQVGTRIVGTVDAARAAVMSRGINVKAVRARKSQQIVRIIITPHAAGKGSRNLPSEHADSCRTTFVEQLFVEHSPSHGGVVRRLFQHKLSNFSTSSRRGSSPGAPTTTGDGLRPGRFKVPLACL